MKRNFQFYKTIILVVASALTLVAVTFAWFTVSYVNSAPEISAAVSGDGALIGVDFYMQDENKEFQPLQDDIKLDNFTPGTYNRYQLLITTKTADKLQIKFAIDDLPEDIPDDLKSSICIKYSLHSTTESVEEDGTVTYTGDKLISISNGYVPLSEIKDGVFFNKISLANYQSTDKDTFILYYEIGLSEDSPTTIGGLKSSLGKIKVSAQRVS